MNTTREVAALSWGLLLVFLAAAGASRAAEIYAHIELVEGAVTIVDTKGKSRTPRVKDTIEEGQTILTGRDGELHARTDDYGFIAVRPSTRMKIEAYRAKGDDNDASVLSLLQGTLRSVTGWIGKYRPSNYAVKTTTATIGIRGTDHEPLFIPPTKSGEKAIGIPGTYDKVNSGRTEIKNQAGRIVVNANQAGFAPYDPKSPPKVLERIPEVYRPTQNEGKIEARKEELAKELEQRRIERKKATSEKEEPKATSEKEERKATSEKEEPKAASENEEPKATSEKEEPKAASEKGEPHKKVGEKKRHPASTK
jgi:hypothetical protein